MSEIYKNKIQHITPAILPKSFDDLTAHIELVQHTVASIQIDVVDGKFAPNKTWPYVGDEAGKFLAIVNQEEGLPYWEDVDFEVDLMVSDPVFVADQWIAAGANRIVVHDTSVDKDTFLSLAQKTHEKGVEVYIGVEQSTVSKAKEYIDALLALEVEQVEGVADKTSLSVLNKPLLAGIQCMGIDRVGFQHNPFNPKVLDMVKEFRELYPSMPISVDGGVNFDNAKALFDAGATRLVVGSTVFEDSEPYEAIEELEDMYSM